MLGHRYDDLSAADEADLDQWVRMTPEQRKARKAAEDKQDQANAEFMDWFRDPKDEERSPVAAMDSYWQRASDRMNGVG